MRLRLIGLALAGLAVLTACGGGGGGSNSNDVPPTGTLELTVVDGDSTAGLSNARVTVIDGATGESIDLLTTDETGRMSKIYNTGALQLRVSKQNYAPSPLPSIPPLPVQILADQTTSITVSIDALPAAERGMISGHVTNSQGQPADSALIVATASEGTLLSTIAGPDGGYVLHNVPTGSAMLNAFLGGYNFDPTGPVTVTADANTDQDIVAVGTASGEISGHVSFTAVSGDIIDVTLLHPGTRDALPKLRTFTNDGGDYLMSGVPNGEFEIIASLENDGYVLDPDESVTQGIPMVVISEVAPIITGKNFKVTGSIQLTNPASNTDGIIPELGDIPVFAWTKASSYASADYYVVDVVDESGDTIWGGFDSAMNFMPLVTVPQGNEPSIGYNSDGTATLAVLEPGRLYQLRVYAAVIDTAELKGYRLLSSSETLDGIFKVTLM
ncbi:MAG: carboxypeptidase-like regulatory domain-containing protein [Pseudomonadota bacterium]